MKVVIFGATGGIGKGALKYALEKGNEVTAFVRSPQKVKEQHERLTLFKGDVTNREDYMNALKGQDAVIWCIGMPIQGIKDFTTVEAHKYLIEAMQANGVKRVIDWATPSLRFPERDKWAVATIVPLLAGLTFLRTGHNEFIAYHRMYVDAGLAWTIVRFCGPTDKPYVENYKVGFGEKHLGMMIPRENIGAFMVEQLESNEYLHSMPIISS
jgi:nucleoside-diphosphate-sugar epimerase